MNTTEESQTIIDLPSIQIDKYETCLVRLFRLNPACHVLMGQQSSLNSSKRNVWHLKTEVMFLNLNSNLLKLVWFAMYFIKKCNLVFVRITYFQMSTTTTSKSTSFLSSILSHNVSHNRVSYTMHLLITKIFGTRLVLV